jgi:hypothetical protein
MIPLQYREPVNPLIPMSMKSPYDPDLESPRSSAAGYFPSHVGSNAGYFPTEPQVKCTVRR